MPATWNDLSRDEQDEVTAIHARLFQPEFLRTIGTAENLGNPDNSEQVASLSSWRVPETMIENSVLPTRVKLDVAGSARIPPELAERTLVISQPSFRSIAQTRFLKSGRPLIECDFGMCSSGYFGAVVFFDFIHSNASRTSMAATLAAAKAIYEGDIFYHDVVWHLIKKPTKDRDTIGLLMLTTSAFILAHEFGHHVLAHRPNLPDTESQRQEFEADRFAFDLLVPMVGRSKLLHGIGIHLQLMRLCESLKGITAGKTHPTSLERWNSLRDDSEPELAMIVSLVEDWMADVLNNAVEMEKLVSEARGLFPFR